MKLSFRLGERAVACVLGAAILCVPCSPLLAQTKKPVAAAKPKAPSQADRTKARAAFERGDQAFKAEDFAAALEAFREANALIPAPQASYKIAVCLDKLGKNGEALEAYKAFLDAPPPEKMAEQKELAEARMAALVLGSVTVITEPAGATLTVDGAPAAGPTPQTLSLKPGTHKLQISAKDYEAAERDVDVVSGTKTEITVTLTAVPPPPAPEPVAQPEPPPAPAPAPAPIEETKPASKMPAYITLGLGGASAVVGTIFGVKALSAKSDFNADGGKTTDNADRAERNALIADMAFGVALTLGITGTVLLLTGDKDKAAEPAKAGQLRLAPIVTPQTQGASALIRFLGGTSSGKYFLPRPSPFLSERDLRNAQPSLAARAHRAWFVVPVPRWL